MGNGGIFSMFPLSKRNFRTTSYDENTRKYDESRQVPRRSSSLTETITVLLVASLKPLIFFAGSRIFSVVSHPKTVKIFVDLWQFFNIQKRQVSFAQSALSSVQK